MEDVGLVLGAAFAEALGDRAGIARFGEARVPMDESRADAVLDVGGRPYAVIDLPFRGERVGALPLQLIEHALEAFARTSGTTLHLSGSGRNDHHLAEAAFKALGRALRVACAPGPAPERRRVHEGLAGPMIRTSPLDGTAAGGRRRLWRRQPGEHRAGSRDARRRGPPGDRTRRPGIGRRARRPRRRRSCAGDAPPRAGRPGRPDPRLGPGRPSLPGDLPRASAGVRGQRRGRGDHPRPPGRADGGPARRADPAPHRLEPGRPPAATSDPRRSRRRRRPLLRPLLRGRTRRTRRPSSRTRPTAAPSRAWSGGARSSASSSIPSGVDPTVAGSWPTSCAGRESSRRPPRRRRTPSRPVEPRSSGVRADAPSPGHPLSRRGRRTGGQGHPLRRSRRRGRPGRACRLLRRRGCRRDRLPRHRRRARGPIDPPGPRGADSPRRRRPADGRRRGPLRGRDAGRPARRRRQGQSEHGRGPRSGPGDPLRGPLRTPGRGRRDRCPTDERRA